jgi:flagellin-like protein
MLQKNQTNLHFEDLNTSVTQYYTTSLMDGIKYSKMKNMQRRAVSDIIAVLLLLGITVAGAVLVSAFFSGGNIIRFDSSNSGSQNAEIKITGFDTRDGLDLSEIDTLDNNLDSPTPILCTVSCNVTPDDLPSASGTDFIVLNLENQGISKVVVQAVEINEIEHTWDSSTGGTDLMLAGTYPDARKFSVIETTNGASIIQRSTNELDRNDEVRLVIKLSDTIDPDIDLNEPISIRLITNLIDENAITITSGSVR